MRSAQTFYKDTDFNITLNHYSVRFYLYLSVLQQSLRSNNTIYFSSIMPCITKTN